MAADTYTSFLGLILQATGNNNNAWGTILNGSALGLIDRAIAGNVNHGGLTGGTLDLSGSPPPAGPTQMLDHIQIFSGTLTSAQTVIVPNLSKTWIIINNTTGAFPLLIKTTSGTAIELPQGTLKHVICDGANTMLRLDRDEVGKIKTSACATASPGELLCNGASYLRTDYPYLFSKIGTTWGAVDSLHFNAPLFTDTNRYLRASSGSLAVGTYQSNTVGPHTHPAGATYSGTTGAESTTHFHTGSGTTSGQSADHTHESALLQTVGSGGLVSTGGGSFQYANTGRAVTTGSSNDHSHTYSFNTGSQSANHTHAYSGTVSAIPANTGTTETRPESAAVLMTITY